MLFHGYIPALYIRLCCFLSLCVPLLCQALTAAMYSEALCLRLSMATPDMSVTLEPGHGTNTLNTLQEILS